jgi:predicted RNase H-like HicB family nuclease
MNEIIFLVEEDVEGGYNARALGESIFTQGESVEELRVNIRDAVNCHFDASEKPKVIRLHFVSEEVLAA